jgi:hypothetical protein
MRQLVVEDLYEKFPAFSSVTDENLIPHNPSAAFARFPDAIFHATWNIITFEDEDCGRIIQPDKTTGQNCSLKYA